MEQSELQLKNCSLTCETSQHSRRPEELLKRKTKN